MRVLTIKKNTNECSFWTFYKVLWCVNPGLEVEVFQVRSSEALWRFHSFITNLCLLSCRQWQLELRSIINCGWEVQTQKEWFPKMMVTVEILLFHIKICKSFQDLIFVEFIETYRLLLPELIWWWQNSWDSVLIW